MDRWIVIHWFELSSLALLCLNLWFIFTVLNVLRETNRWLTILSRWLDRMQSPDARPPENAGRDPPSDRHGSR